MKKLSLILALMLVLTCGVFASCGDDADTSSTASTASDVSKTESKEESKTESKDDSSEASSDVTSGETSEEAPAPATGDVISVGASYTKSLLYRQGGREVEWGWDENAPIAYPDEEDKSLTDGKFPEVAGYGDAAWAGFHAKAPDYVTDGFSWITIDLGEVKAISGAKLYVATGINADNAAAGIFAPSAVEFFVSEDGENFTSIGSTAPANVEEIEVLSVACEANARFVKVQMNAAGWMFVSEMEVLAPAAEADESATVSAE